MIILFIEAQRHFNMQKTLFLGGVFAKMSLGHRNHMYSKMSNFIAAKKMNGQYCTKFSTFVRFPASCLGFPRIERSLLKMNEWLLEITR